MPQPAKSAQDLNTERFHLLLGLCVKALCSTRLTYSAETVTSCINAVNSLLEAPWARNCLGADNVSVLCILILLCCESGRNFDFVINLNNDESFDQSIILDAFCGVAKCAS